jgi:hypothetical protein
MSCLLSHTFPNNFKMDTGRSDRSGSASQHLYGDAYVVVSKYNTVVTHNMKLNANTESGRIHHIFIESST